MAKCPRCGVNIDHLVVDRFTHVYQDVDLNSNGELRYGSLRDGSMEEDDGEIFFCPECDSLVASNEDDAIKFLSGKLKE